MTRRPAHAEEKENSRMRISNGEERDSTRSSIAFGEVLHWRAEPKEHSFRYPIFTFQLDVDQTRASAPVPRWFFGANQRAIFSVHDEDYLRGPGNLRERVEKILAEVGGPVTPARITLITMPRYFGYVFNPVSFFACFDAQDRVVAFITQVNNTFGETHVYPLVCEPTPLPVTWRFPKEFFVSPFFDSEGEYEVTLKEEGKNLNIEVNLEKEKKLAFSATLLGAAEPLTRQRLWQVLKRYPITTFLTMPRIHLQAMTLYFGVRTCPFKKPTPNHPYTIRSQQNIIHKARLALLSLMKAVRKA
jgi:cyclopropane-fatty-acyl-phospholipid synthase